MKHAKKLLAVVMVLAMVAAFSAIAFAANPSVSFAVSDYADGKATVSVKFVDAVGLTSGSLNFAYPDGKVTKIVKKNGTDAKAIGDVDNAFSSEFNSGSNPAEFGFYFKNNLWSSEDWAAADGADETVNGENFECAKFEFTAENGTVITVTGELKIGDNVTPVNTTFKIGTASAPVVTTTEAPKPVDETTTKKEEPAPAETTTKKADPVPSQETTTVKPVVNDEIPTKEETVKYDKFGKRILGYDKNGQAIVGFDKNGKFVYSDDSSAGYEESTGEVPTKETSVKYDKYGNRILGYDKNGQAIIGFKFGQPIYSKDPAAHKVVVLDVGANNNGKDFVGDKDGKTTTTAPDKDGKTPTTTAKDSKQAACNSNNGTGAKTGTKTVIKTDGGKNTGDNSILAIVAGVVALAGAAYVVTKKRK